MKYSNIMGYKNYVGRKAYQQAKSEGKSQEECKQSSKYAKENVPNYGDNKKNNIGRLQITLKHWRSSRNKTH